MQKLEVTIEVIVHATEDASKFFENFKEIFELDKEAFLVSDVFGHFENPITIMRAKITKKNAFSLLDKFLDHLSKSQKNEIIQEIEDRTADSTLHIRLDKQEFVKGKISFKDKDAIKLKIHTPIYNKRDTIKVFSEIFHVN